MLDDATGPQQYHLQIYPIVITDNITVYLWGRKFSKYRNITKTQGTGFNHPPTSSPPLYKRWGKSLHVCPRVYFHGMTCTLAIGYQSL